MLNLNSMNLTKVDACTFNNLTQLQYLNLSHNQLTFLDVSLFRSLKNLQTLDISYNQLTVIDPFQLAGLTNLLSLTMSHNPFLYLNASLTFDCINITYMDLSSDNIKFAFTSDEVSTFEFYLQSISNRFTKLQEIHLENNYFGIESLVMFQFVLSSFQNQNLITVYLLGNPIYENVTNIESLCGSNTKCLIVPNKSPVTFSPTTTTSSNINCSLSCKFMQN